MAIELEGLEFQLEAKTSEGVKGVEALAKSLETLKKAVSGKDNLGKTTKSIESLGKALSGFHTDKLDGMTRALQGFQNLGNCRVSSTLPRRITEISEAANGISEAGIERLERMTTALSNLRDLRLPNRINVPTINNVDNEPTVPQDSGVQAVDSTVEEITDGTEQAISGVQRLKDILSNVGGVFKRAFTGLGGVLRVLGTGLQATASMAKKFANAMLFIPKSLGSHLAAKVKQFTAGLGQLFSSLKRIAMYRLIRSAIAAFTRGLSEGIKNLYQYSLIVGGQFAGSMNQLATSALYVKNSLAAMVAPILDALAPAIDFVTEKLVYLFNLLNQLLARLGGKTTTTIAKKVTTQFEEAAGAAKELKKSILGFDELNPLKDNSSSGGKESPDYSSMFEEIPIDNSISDFVDKLKQAFEKQDWKGLGTLLGDKFNEIVESIDWGGVGTKIGKAINGAVQTAYYFLDTADFYNLGKHIAEMLNNALEEIDWEFVGRLIVKPFTSLADLIIGFIRNTDWGLVGKSLSDCLIGLFNECSDWLKSYDWKEFGEWLGQAIRDFTANVDWKGIADAATEAFTLAIQAIKDILSGLPDEIKTVGAAFLAWKFSSEFMSALGTLTKIPKTVSVGVVLTITGITLEAGGIIDAIKNGIDGFNFGEIVGGGLLGTGGIALLGSKLAAWITASFADSAVAAAIATAGENLGLATAGATGAALGAGVAGIILGIPAMFVGIYDAIKNGMDWLNGLLIPAGATAAGAGIGAIIGACGGPIGAGIGALIGLAVGLIVDGITLIVQNWDTITEFFKNFFTVTIPGLWNDFTHWITQTVPEWFKSLPGKISTGFSNLWKPIKEFDWKGLGYDIGQWFGNAVKDAIEFVTVKVPNWFANLFETIKSAFITFFTETLPKFFTETLPQAFEAVVTFFKELPEKLWNAVKEGWDWLVGIGKSIIDGIWEGLQSVWKAITDFVDGFVQGFKNALGIHSPSTVFRDEIGKFLGLGLLDGIAGVFKNISTWVKKNIVTPLKNALDKIGLKIQAAIELVKDGWDTLNEWVGEIKDKAVKLVRSGWRTLSEWAGEVGTKTVRLVQSGWTTLREWVGEIGDKAVSLVRSGWTTLSSWVGEIGSKAVTLVKSGWTTLSSWVGEIATKGVALFRDGWTTLTDWVGTIAAKGVSLVKSGWTTLSSWVGEIGSKAVSLTKSGWTTLSYWVGEIGSKAVSLTKSGWTTLSAWVGEIGSKAVSLAKKDWTTISAFVGTAVTVSISLIKSGWSTISGFVGNAVSVGISLTKSGWTYLSTFIGNALSVAVSLTKSGWTSLSSWIGTTVSTGISLVKSGWTSLSSWVGSSVSVGVSLWKNGWTSISSFVGTTVSVGISLFKSGWSSIKSFFGLSNGGILGANGGCQIFSDANGGAYDRGIPLFGNGTNGVNHGTMFVAGEKGAEMVGHLNGRTEVMNRFQLASVMKTSVVEGMARYANYLTAITNHMTTCTNATVTAILYSANNVLSAVNGKALTVGEDYIAWMDALSERMSDGGDGSSEQIAEGIRAGLYETTNRQNELLREQNELLRQILDKDTTVEVTTNSFTKALNRKNQRDGKVIVPVGV